MNFLTQANLAKRLKRKERELKKLEKRKKKLWEKFLFWQTKDLKSKEKLLKKEIREFQNQIEKFEREEAKIKRSKQKIEEKERKEKDLIKKRVFEKRRWEIEEKERKIEKQKWALEDKLRKKEKEFLKIQKISKKEILIKENLKKINREIGSLKEEIKTLRLNLAKQLNLERKFKEAWKKFLSGDTFSALQILKEIQKEISEETEKIPQEEISQEKKEVKEFFGPLIHYKKGDLQKALSSLNLLVQGLEKPSQKQKIPKEEISEPKKEALPAKEISLIVQTKTEKENQEKKTPEQRMLEEFKKKLKEEQEKIIKEEKEKLKKLREEFAKKQREILKTAIKGRRLELEEKKLKTLMSEMLRQELEIEREVQRRLQAQKENLLQKEKELKKAEESLSLTPLSEAEKRARESIIYHLRKKIEEQRKGLENKAWAEIKEKEALRKQRLQTLQNVFEQALYFYNEKEFDKAKRIFTIIKEQIEKEKELGVLKDFEQIPFYEKTLRFLKNLEKTSTLQPPLIKKTPKKSKFYKEQKYKIRLSKTLYSFKQIFFPLPIVGLDISDYSLELVCLKKGGRISVYAREILEFGVLLDGKVKDSKLFSHHLKSLLKKANFPPFQPKKGPVVRAVVSLPHSAIYTFVFRLDIAKDLFQQVREKLEETLPFSLEEFYWDYIVCGKDNSEKVKVICVTAEKDVVDTLIYFLRANGIEPVALDAGMFATQRALLSSLRPKERIGVLDIGAYITNFYILNKKGIIDFATSMPYAIYGLQNKIADFFRISSQNAENLLKKSGLKDPSLKKALVEEINKLVSEIQEAIEHYRAVFNLTIKEIFLVGGGAIIPGIKETLGEQLSGLRIQLINPFLQIKGRVPPFPTALLFVGALGLATRGLLKNPAREGINLLPEELKRKEREARLSLMRKKFLLIKIGVGIILSLIFIIILYFLIIKK